MRLVRFLREHWLLLTIFTVGIVLRTWRFGEIPGGLNQDEASTAYDAWSVLHYGVDRMGVWLPLMYISWGSGMYALPGYLMSPFLLLIGLTVSAARMLNLCMGIASLPIFYLLVQHIADRRRALIAVFLLAIIPWHIMISRWALDTNLLPALFLLAVFFLSRSTTRYWLLYPCAALFALCLYVYGTAYVIVPVYLIGAAVFLWQNGRPPLRTAICTTAVFALIAFPIGLFVVINHW